MGIYWDVSSKKQVDLRKLWEFIYGFMGVREWYWANCNQKNNFLIEYFFYFPLMWTHTRAIVDQVTHLYEYTSFVQGSLACLREKKIE